MFTYDQTSEYTFDGYQLRAACIAAEHGGLIKRKERKFKHKAIPTNVGRPKKKKRKKIHG